ncbi:MAG: adenosylmethionine decarboxylase [Victivallaceae bacterium]|nr:adenosylmethionine decarboxylase [Victivallaceae bacterium]MDD4181770.1 adenosylmethionine decarboxylase [Victivallaceae bacterium]
MKDSVCKGHRDFALGKHMTIEFYDCDSSILADPVKMENIFIEAAHASGATVIGQNFHSFEPQGVSGFVVIAESHFSVHSWPEHDYAAVDIFTCGESISFDAAVESLKNGMQSRNTIISSVMNRGIVSNNGIERMVPVYEGKKECYAMDWKSRFDESQAWGLQVSVDVYNCAPEIIRGADEIKRYVSELCKKLDIKRHGDTTIVNFGHHGELEGFTMTQLIETSLISGHFANNSNNAYIDVFSCKYFEPREVAEFSIEFFKGAHYRMQVALRR